jgi:hypothetical protein
LGERRLAGDPLRFALEQVGREGVVGTDRKEARSRMAQRVQILLACDLDQARSRRRRPFGSRWTARLMRSTSAKSTPSSCATAWHDGWSTLSSRGGAGRRGRPSGRRRRLRASSRTTFAAIAQSQPRIEVSSRKPLRPRQARRNASCVRSSASGRAPPTRRSTKPYTASPCSRTTVAKSSTLAGGPGRLGIGHDDGLRSRRVIPRGARERRSHDDTRRP